jgi:hypothetical protein
MGLLSLTVRTQVPALSWVPTQSSCQVECAEEDAAVARRRVVYFIFGICGCGCGWKGGKGVKGVDRMQWDVGEVWSSIS